MTRTLGLGGALVIAALLLGLPATLGLLDWIDRPLFGALALTRAHSPGWVITVAQYVTALGNPPVRAIFVTAAIAVITWQRHWREALVFIVTVGIAAACDTAIKESYGRARPTIVPHLDNVLQLAYPSGHAANSMVVLLMSALLIGRRDLIAAAVALSVAIGLSRVALGVHWPSDVIGGWMFGIGAALIGTAFAQRIEARARASAPA